ncbi:MAG: DNA repair protein RecO [bacterium]
MKQLKSKVIVLSRTDYGEADRILTLLSEQHGKISVIARGVRKPKSKLAGGIELFSVSEITYLEGKGNLDTLISARLVENYENVVHQIDRVQLGYEFIKLLNKITEDDVDTEYFAVLRDALSALNDDSINHQFVEAWFAAQILKLEGHTPNLLTGSKGEKLAADNHYNFDVLEMTFENHPSGTYSDKNIKIIRLLFSNNTPKRIYKIEGFAENYQVVLSLIKSMKNFYLNI